MKKTIPAAIIIGSLCLIGCETHQYTSEEPVFNEEVFLSRTLDSNNINIEEYGVLYDHCPRYVLNDPHALTIRCYTSQGEFEGIHRKGTPLQNDTSIYADYLATFGLTKEKCPKFERISADGSAIKCFDNNGIVTGQYTRTIEKKPVIVSHSRRETGIKFGEIISDTFSFLGKALLVALQVLGAAAEGYSQGTSNSYQAPIYDPGTMVQASVPSYGNNNSFNTIRPIGNGYMVSGNGTNTMFRQTGNSMIGSDGTTIHRTGNNSFIVNSNNGSESFRSVGDGKFIFGSKGTRCTKVGSIINCTGN